jgi:TolB-like protein/Tfp pilus assembly protein PilF
MADSARGERLKSDPPTDEPRLESWGEIAAYLRREIRTVQRWEKYQGLPIRRLTIGKLGSVYAYRSELDKWYRERQPQAEAEIEACGKESVCEVLEPEPQPVSVPPAAEENKGDIKRKRWSKQRWVIGVAVILFATAGVAYLAIPHSPVKVVRTPARTRLFVRPFTNSGGDSQQNEFIAGLTDETITQLGQIDPSRLGVIAPTSARLLAAKPIEELGHLLKVAYVLEGSVRRSGNQVRIDAQLISVDDQTPIWSKSYTNDLSDILQVQDQVAMAITKEIQAKIPAIGLELSSGRPVNRVNPAAYDAYLRGRLFWTNRDLPRSIDAFQQALREDPRYSLARTGLASAYLLSGQVPNDAMPPNQAMPKARDNARQAIEEDPSIAEAHCVLANISANYDWDFPAAEREYLSAIKLDANNPTAHEWYGHYLITRNRLAEAQAETSLALDLDPVSPLLNSARAETFFYARDYDNAIAQARRTLEQYPNNLYASFWLASAEREKRMFSEAVSGFAQLSKTMADNPAMLMAYGHALAVSGDQARAQRVLSDLKHLAQRRYVPAVYFAVMYVGLGEKDTAFTWFDKAFRERNDRLAYMAVDPLSDPVRSDPRFQKLLARIGLP